uniref:Uncharacterized protein n=1 Tax=Psilocybe cubensis TaxID=181762 RepID=A0A8H7XXQ8_PSICU
MNLDNLYSAPQHDAHPRNAHHDPTCCSISSTYKPTRQLYQAPSYVTVHKVTIARHKSSNKIMLYTDCAPGGPEFDILGTETASGPLSWNDRVLLAEKYATVESKSPEIKDGGEVIISTQESLLSMATRNTPERERDEEDTTGTPRLQSLNFLADRDSPNAEASAPPRRRRTIERYKTQTPLPVSTSTPLRRGRKRKRGISNDSGQMMMSSPLSLPPSETSNEATPLRPTPKSDMVLRSRKL